MKRTFGSRFINVGNVGSGRDIVDKIRGSHSSGRIYAKDTIANELRGIPETFDCACGSRLTIPAGQSATSVLYKHLRTLIHIEWSTR